MTRDPCAAAKAGIMARNRNRCTIVTAVLVRTNQTPTLWVRKSWSCRVCARVEETVKEIVVLVARLSLTLHPIF